MSRASDVRSLTQDIAQAHDDRAQEQVERTRRIAEIGKETAALLQHFDEAHVQMSTRLKAQLAKEKQGITRAEMERKKACQADAKARAEEAEERADEVISIRSEARDLVESFSKDSAEAAAAWRDLVAAMQARRGMAAGPRPARPPVAEAIEEEMPMEEVVPEEKQKLQNRILDLIMEHAEGIKLAQMTEATGEARVKLGNITRMLLDEGKIRKEGLLYFLAE